MQELEAYTEGNQKHYQLIDPIEISLEKIRRALFGFFGMKDADKPAEREKKFEKAAMAKVTNKAKEAWIEAGMPSPAGDWLRRYAEQNDG